MAFPSRCTQAVLIRGQLLRSITFTREYSYVAAPAELDHGSAINKTAREKAILCVSEPIVSHLRRARPPDLPCNTFAWTFFRLCYVLYTLSLYRVDCIAIHSHTLVVVVFFCVAKNGNTLTLWLMEVWGFDIVILRCFVIQWRHFCVQLLKGVWPNMDVSTRIIYHILFYISASSAAIILGLG